MPPPQGIGGLRYTKSAYVLSSARAPATPNKNKDSPLYLAKQGGGLSSIYGLRCEAFCFSLCGKSDIAAFRRRDRLFDLPSSEERNIPLL